MSSRLDELDGTARTTTERNDYPNEQDGHPAATTGHPTMNSPPGSPENSRTDNDSAEHSPRTTIYPDCPYPELEDIRHIFNHAVSNHGLMICASVALADGDSGSVNLQIAEALRAAVDEGARSLTPFRRVINWMVHNGLLGSAGEWAAGTAALRLCDGKPRAASP